MPHVVSLPRAYLKAILRELVLPVSLLMIVYPVAVVGAVALLDRYAIETSRSPHLGVAERVQDVPALGVHFGVL